MTARKTFPRNELGGKEPNADVQCQSESNDAAVAPISHRRKILWHYVIGFVLLHAHSIYGVYILLAGYVHFGTFVCALVAYSMATLGITVGAHRLWSHRSYTARLPMRVLLAVFQTMSFQYSIYKWSRDHRVHHKYLDTDADPHNSSRGFFYSHIAWLMVERHPDVYAKGRTIDMRDLEADPVVMWQKKYFLWLVPFTFLIPSMIPWLFWNEDFWYSFTVVGILRYLLSLHATFLVNSVAHTWGTRPYDRNISPVENATVSVLVFGDGWHNYHHTFPWDYKSDELGSDRLNFGTAFIDAFARLGLAYDLKTTDPRLVAKRSRRTGDGSRDEKRHRRRRLRRDDVWGWGDADMDEDDKRTVLVIKSPEPVFGMNDVRQRTFTRSRSYFVNDT